MPPTIVFDFCFFLLWVFLRIVSFDSSPLMHHLAEYYWFTFSKHHGRAKIQVLDNLPKVSPKFLLPTSSLRCCLCTCVFVDPKLWIVCFWISVVLTYPKNSPRWCFWIFSIFTPTWGDDPISRSYFSDGLKPPTSPDLIQDWMYLVDLFRRNHHGLNASFRFSSDEAMLNPWVHELHNFLGEK